MFYVHDDCKCGYATHNTGSCSQKECSFYYRREAKMAQIDLLETNRMALEIFTERYNKAVLRSNSNETNTNIRGSAETS